jgi:hypothetical protein
MIISFSPFCFGIPPFPMATPRREQRWRDAREIASPRHGNSETASRLKMATGIK